MGKFIAWDESGHRETYDVQTAEEAADAYVDGGDWGDKSNATAFHTIYVVNAQYPDDPPEMLRVTVDPEEPPCRPDWDDRDTWREEHGWHETSVQGNGGGVISTETCRHCRRKKVTNTWDYDRSNGEQGITSITYPDPEDE